MAISVAKNVRECVLIGDRTAGAVQFGNVLGYELPYTHVVMYVPSALFLNELEEGYGHQPDYWIDSPDVLEELLLWLKDRENYCAIR